MADHLLIAANMIADEARRLSSFWSVQVPASIRVTGGGTSATISSGVGPSYPNEVLGVIHPVFGPTIRDPHPGHVLNKYRPFLAPAVDAKAEAATVEVAKIIDDYAREAGFEGTG